MKNFRHRLTMLLLSTIIQNCLGLGMDFFKWDRPWEQAWITSSLSHTQKQTEGHTQAHGHNNEECVQSGLPQSKPQPFTHTAQASMWLLYNAIKLTHASHNQLGWRSLPTTPLPPSCSPFPPTPTWHTRFQWEADLDPVLSPGHVFTSEILVTHPTVAPK